MAVRSFSSDQKTALYDILHTSCLGKQGQCQVDSVVGNKQVSSRQDLHGHTSTLTTSSYHDSRVARRLSVEPHSIYI